MRIPAPGFAAQLRTDTSDHWLTPDRGTTFTVTVLNSPRGRLVLEWTGRAEDEGHARTSALQAARIARQVAHIATGASKRTIPDVATKVVEKDKAVAEYAKRSKTRLATSDLIPERRIKVGTSIVGRPHPRPGQASEIKLTPGRAILAAQAAFRCAAEKTPVSEDCRTSIDLSRNHSGRTIAYGVSIDVIGHMDDDARMTDPLRDALTACSILLWMRNVELPSPWAKLDSATLEAGKHVWKTRPGPDDLKVVTDFLHELDLADVAQAFAATYGPKTD